MPAEYGVDPTGIGRVLGLTEMGEIKAQLAKEAAAADAAELAAGTTAAAVAVPAPKAAPMNEVPGAATAPQSAAAGADAGAGATAAIPKSDEVSIRLLPNQGKEIKLAMQKDARVNYSWSTDVGVVNYDTHADRTAPPAIKYHGYAKGQAKASDEGVLVAAFDGMHGWFWRNRTRQPVTVTLRTSGDYRQLKRME